MRDRILAALADGPHTVPEIATAIERPTHEVMFWVMGMRRYGFVREIKEAPQRATSVTSRCRKRPGRDHASRPQPLSGAAPLRRHRYFRLLQLRRLFRHLPALGGRRIVPAPHPATLSSACERSSSSPELWSCYGCAECTKSCPTQADPAAFMAATRRYAVASYDRTHVAYLLATSRVFATVFVVALVGLLAAFMYSVHRPVGGSTLAFFEFVPSEFVHTLGIIVMALMGTAMIVGLFEMIRRVIRGPAAAGVKAKARKTADAAVTQTAPSRSPRRDSARTAPTPPRPTRRLPAAPPKPGPGIRSAGSSTSRPCGASWACLAPRCSTTGSNCSGSRRPAPPCPSGTRCGCSARWPAPCSSTEPRS